MLTIGMMISMTRQVLSFACRVLLLSATLAGGQPVGISPSYSVRGWHAESEDGPPENKIMSLAQTRDGYLWIGTYSGLARFDGVHFSVFDSSNTREVRDSSVTSLFESADGALWIGHVTGEITRLRKGRFENVATPPGGSLARVKAFCQDSAGDIWFLTAAGLLTRLRDGGTATPPSGQATNLLTLA